MRIIGKRLAWNRCTASLLLVSMFLPTFSGCSRRFWREQAEGDTYRAISEKLTDERWQNPRMDLTPDPRSRFYDPYDPDCEPLPPDDPAAHQFMHCVDGKEHSKHWHDMGDTITVENPAWLEPYQVLLNSGNPVEGHEMVEIPKVTLKQAVDLAYIHSRDYQTQVELVYLRALNVTGRRYLLNTRFDLRGPGFGGALFGATFPHSGNHVGQLRNGLGIRQVLPSGGDFAINVLNSVTWNMGNGFGSAPSIGWSITQPLLNRAGRKVVLESLTQAERFLLYGVRDMARFRQVLFSDIAEDYLRLQQTAQTITNAENNIRQLEEQIEIGRAEDDRKFGQISVFLFDFPEGAEIPESLENRLFFRENTLQWVGVEMTEEQKTDLLAISDDPVFQAQALELIQFREQETTSLNVLQLVTRKGRAENTLQGARRALADQLDLFKIRLGLPPNIQMSVDDRFLAPFELIDRDLLALADDLKDFAKQQGPLLLPSDDAKDAANDVELLSPDLEDLKLYLESLVKLKDRVATVGLEQVKQDFVPVRDVLGETGNEELESKAGSRDFGSQEERDRVIRDVANDLRLFRLGGQTFEQIAAALDALNQALQVSDVDALVNNFDTDGDGLLAPDELPIDWNSLPGMSFKSDEVVENKTGAQVLGMVRDAAMDMRERLLKIVTGLQVVQAGLRVEAIALNRFTLPESDQVPDIEEVVRIALNSRHDLMNARGLVMDDRRLVEVAANDLMSVLDVSASGQVDPDSGNNDSTSVTIDFKTPIDQVAARNAYNEALINYQRSRRAYMSAEDTVKNQVRTRFRQLMVARERLEIDRQTVRNAALEYDNVAGGGGGGQGNSLNLLNALDSVLTAQNSLVNDWISYETNRLNIFRDMGIMELDQNGVWVDGFYQTDDQPTSDDMPASSELFPELQSDTELQSEPGLQSDTTVTDPDPAIPVLPEIPANE